MEAKVLKSGLSANTVHHVHVVLSKALKDAMRKGLIYRNVCQVVQPPNIGRYEVNVPDQRAIARILELARWIKGTTQEYSLVVIPQPTD